MQLPSDMMGFTCSCSPANCLLMRSSSISLLLGPELASCICCLIATLSASLVFLLSFFKRMITIISTSVHRQTYGTLAFYTASTVHTCFFFALSFFACATCSYMCS
jgi:hypothetical protein